MRKPGRAVPPSPGRAPARSRHPAADGERICVAQIGAAHGIRGEVRLRAFTEDPMAVVRYGMLETRDGARSFTIAAARLAKGFLVARLEGIDDRTAAERLTNTELYVARARLPAIDEAETYYHADLIGLAVVGADGRLIGTVAAIHNFGAGDLLEVKPASGRASVLLRFTEDVVPQVDLKARRLVVEPPDGAFDPPGPAAAPED